MLTWVLGPRLVRMGAEGEGQGSGSCGQKPSGVLEWAAVSGNAWGGRQG